MTKAAVACDPGPDAALCRFSLAHVTVEVVACGAVRADELGLASFDYRGVHFLVREVRDGAAAPDELHQILTAREREIVRLVASGLRNKQIAYGLRLSEYTVAAYIKNICYKLQVRNRTAMVTRCNQLAAMPLGEVARDARRGHDGWRGERHQT